jgi:hypothetical protein
VQIDAVNLKSGQVSSTQTWASGGYELPLAAGQYRIIASVNNTVFQTTNVTISNVNVEQDFVLSNSWQGGSRSSAIGAAQPAPVVTASAPQPAAVIAPVPQLAALTAPVPQPAAVTAPAPQPTTVTPPAPQPATAAAPAPQPVTSQPTPDVWVVPLPNYQTSNSQQKMIYLLASSWSSWNAGSN